MTKRDRIMLMVIGAVALVIGFYMMVLAPQQKAAKDMQAQVTSARDALKAAQAKAAEGQKSQDDYRRDRATIVKIGRAVPETDDVPGLITQLEALAKKDNVWFTAYNVAEDSGSSADSGGATTTTTAAGQDPNSSTAAVAPLYPPGSVQMSGGLGRTPIRIGLKGEYFNLERYLQDVERFAVLSQKKENATGRLMIVDGFTYQSSDRVAWLGGKVENLKKVGKSIFLKAELGASVYFAPPLSTPSNSGSAGAASGAATPGASAAPSSTGAATVGGVQ